MKRIVVATTLATAFAISAGISSAATGVTSVNAFVRSAPSIDAAPIGSVKKGLTLEYTAAPDNANWLKIQFKGKEGYIGKKIVVASAKPTKSVAKEGGVAAQKPEVVVVAKTPVFEIVPDVSTEELRLKNENAKQADRIKDLESEIPRLKKEIDTLKQEIKTKGEQVARYHAMFPYIKVIESVESEGRDVLLNGIGKARMIESGKQIVVRLEGDNLAAAERIMKGVAKERYQTGGEHTRVYYVLSSQSVKSTGTN
ncbi:SH3 domain-containing protein [Geomonas subterranea]|uniref:SH3 domain-containing protein n=1 Tax=Geomonas subterranea TaxID=2847989 RepID=UPI001CD74307|nr:SH3 domain-containing protein [Geomonas fuzhouensis]